MRCLIISDIHANLAAFEAVLKNAAKRHLRFDIVWCLGDIVGYGPDPNECIDLLRNVPHICLAGNHDWAVLGKLNIETFHENAAFVVEWTQARLTRENLNYLHARPEKDVEGDYLLAHASPREPIWEYVLDTSVAEENFVHEEMKNVKYALIGHTHVPAIFFRDSVTLAVHAATPTPNIPLVLEPNCSYIINPGSVGQPRDGDPRAAYALLDTEKLTWTPYRVEYSIKRTQERMRAAGFPDRLIERLSHGR